MRLLKILEDCAETVGLNLVEHQKLRVGMSSYDVDIDTDDDRVHLTVLQNGMDVGEVVYEDGEIVWIHVEPFFRKTGLGSAMVKYLQDKGYPVVMPDARTDDGKAFFNKLDQQGQLDEIIVTGEFDDDDFQSDWMNTLTNNADFGDEVGTIGDVSIRPLGDYKFVFFKDNHVIGEVGSTAGNHPIIGPYRETGLFWIDANNRRRGLGTNFYKWLLDEKGVAVMSDGHLTDAAATVWDKLLHQYEVVVIDDGDVSSPITHIDEYYAVFDKDEYVKLVALPQKRKDPILTEGTNTNCIVVDVQPEYTGLNDGNELPWIDELMEFLNKQGNILMFVNAEETGLTSDTIDDVKVYWEDSGFDPHKWQQTEIVDKGYGYLRAWMDEGVQPNVIIKVIRELYQQGVNDTRDLYGGDVEQLAAALGETWEDWMEHDPLIVEWTSLAQLKRFSGSLIMGGGREECLREVELLMNAFNIKYRRVEDFVYG